MLDVFIQGFALSTAMILPLGPQNTFVMNQGIRRQYHLMSAFLCALSDIILICSGIFGGSVLLSSSPLLLKWVTWGGVAFLLWYGWGSLKSALSIDVSLATTTFTTQSRWRIALMLLAVTWLNPHVYLDTFVVLGSLGGQLLPDVRPWFAFGAVSASALWFFSLALLAACLAPKLNRPQTQRIIHILVAVVMWGIAFQLARQGWNS